MKLYIFLAILIVLMGCTQTISGTQDLILTQQEIQNLNLQKDLNNSDLSQLGIEVGENSCKTESQDTKHSSLAQNSLCTYIIPEINTEIIIELKKFTNLNDLNGSYQYGSSHLLGSKGIISENTFGDQSKFHVNNEDDYGAEFNQPGIFYYHLWITKDLYLIHITSEGSEDAKEYIKETAKVFLSKFS